MAKTKLKTSVYDIITQKILEEMEKGIVPWRKRWMTRPAVSHLSGKQYSFINQFLLDVAGGEWLTFNQVRELGGKVKAREHSKIVLFFTLKEKKREDLSEEELMTLPDDEKVVKIPIPKYYNVFEVGQCEGIERKYPYVEEKKNEPLKEAEKIVERYKKANPSLIIDQRQQNSAHYEPNADRIVVPDINQYTTVDDFYDSLFHEMVHSTMHKERCNRKSDDSFGTKGYAKEELIAEIGSAVLCDKVGITTTLNNSAAYIKSWMKRLEDDSSLIVSAAAKAEKAVKYILGEEA